MRRDWPERPGTHLGHFIKEEKRRQILVKNLRQILRDRELLPEGKLKAIVDLLTNEPEE
jgi:hypothetical protein